MSRVGRLAERTGFELLVRSLLERRTRVPFRRLVLVRRSPLGVPPSLTRSAGRPAIRGGVRNDGRPEVTKSKESSVTLQGHMFFDLLWRGERALVGSTMALEMISGFSKPRPDPMRPPFGVFCRC